MLPSAFLLHGPIQLALPSTSWRNCLEAPKNPRCTRYAQGKELPFHSVHNSRQTPALRLGSASDLSWSIRGGRSPIPGYLGLVGRRAFFLWPW